MSISTLMWKLASPYDAYVSHVARLQDAVDRIRYYGDRALEFEAGIESSIRIVAGDSDPGARAMRFREQLGTAAAEMSDEDFEGFLAHLGGGKVAQVESNRVQAASRMNQMTLLMAEHFGIAGRELAVLESRGYNPRRRDVAIQLRANHLPEMTLAEFRRLLHELGSRVGQKPVE